MPKMCHAVRKIKICFDLFTNVSMAVFKEFSHLKIEFSCAALLMHKSIDLQPILFLNGKIHKLNINCEIF